MVIVTANISSKDLEMGDKLVGENGLYTSRSELIRNAIREFLLEKHKMLKELEQPHYTHISEEKQEYESEQKQYVRIPIEKNDENSKSNQEFKVYKIIKKLES